MLKMVARRFLPAPAASIVGCSFHWENGTLLASLILDKLVMNSAGRRFAL
jgi:hypothetical protein